jgi:hypothetical protein
MVERTYGVTSAAGVKVTEEEIRGPIQAGRFGTGGLVGAYERGPVMDPIVMVGPKQQKRKVGGRLANSLAPDAVTDFWDNSGGAGTMVAVRVTDGNEREAYSVVMGRTTGMGLDVSPTLKTDAEEPLIPILKIIAKNGGRWAGREQIHFFNDLTITGNITETTVDTGMAMLEDELVGAFVILDGAHPDAAKQYEVVSNTAAGVLTVRPGSTMLTDVNGAVQSTVDVYVDLSEVSLGTAKSKGLSYLITEGSLDPALEFGLKIYIDGEYVYGWSSLSMNPLSPRYVVNVVNNDDSNEEITVEDLLQTGVAITEFNRPANFSRMVKAITATKVTFQNVVASQNDDPTKVTFVGYTQASQELAPGKLIFTWDLTGTQWDVTFEEHQQAGVSFSDLGSVSIAAAPEYNKEWVSPTNQLPSVQFDHTADPADGEQFVVEILPVVDSMVGGKVYPDVDTAQLTGFKIRSVDHESVTVESGDPSSIGSVGDQGNVTGTVDLSTAGGGVTVVAATSDKMVISVDGRDDMDVALTAGASQDITDILADIQTAIDAKFGAGAFVIGSSEAGAGTIEYLKLTSPGGFDGAGPGASIALKNTDAITDATYTLLGFTVDAAPTGVATYTGTSGTRARIEYLQPLSYGYDGLAPDVTKYLAALALDASPFSQLRESGYGNIMLNVPGLTENDALSASDVILIHKQGFRYAESMPYTYFAETPLDKLDEVDIVNYWNTDVGRSDMGLTYIPSYRYIVDPDAPKQLKLISSMPGVMGNWAAKAVANEGYHRPAAGTDAELHETVKLPDGFTGLDEDFLTPGGFNVIKKKRGSFLIWGARTLYENSQWRQATVRHQMNHYVWVFLDNFDWVIFALSDEETYTMVEAAAVEYLDKEVGKRVLDNTRGVPYSVKIDADNNPQDEVDAGRANMDIKLRFTKFIEQLNISVGAGGVTEAV